MGGKVAWSSPYRVLRWLPLLFVILGISCSSGLNSVEGKVLYKGKPAKGAIVIFHPKGDNTINARKPSGYTDEEGVFTLSSTPGKPKDGAVAGEYAVTIEWPEEPKDAKPKFSTEPAPPPPDRLEGRYADQKKSGLSAVITSGPNRLPPFELK
jgi:hypothetical protein